MTTFIQSLLQVSFEVQSGETVSHDSMQVNLWAGLSLVPKRTSFPSRGTTSLLTSRPITLRTAWFSLGLEVLNTRSWSSWQKSTSLASLFRQTRFPLAVWHTTRRRSRAPRCVCATTRCPLRTSQLPSKVSAGARPTTSPCSSCSRSSATGIVLLALPPSYPPASRPLSRRTTLRTASCRSQLPILTLVSGVSTLSPRTT